MEQADSCGTEACSSIEETKAYWAARLSPGRIACSSRRRPNMPAAVR